MSIDPNLLSPRRRSALPLVLTVLVLMAGAFALGRFSVTQAASGPVPDVQVAAAPAGGEPASGAGGGPAASGAIAAAPKTPLTAPAAPAPDPTRKQLSVEIAGSLDASITSVVGPDVGAPLALVTSRLLVWWLDVSRDVRPGDALSLVYELPADKEPLVHALRFRSGKLAKELVAYRYAPQGAEFGRYYDREGKEIELRLVDSPIEGYEQITSLLKDGRRHKGVDFKTAVGTPVVMPWDGTVRRKNWNFRGNGNCLEIVDAKGRKILFLHLDELSKGIKAGTKVRKGQQVARSGNTGRSTAPHLHYQLMSSSGRVLDPFDVHETERRELDASQRDRFASVVRAFDELLEPEAAAVAATTQP